jgi:hypothetical protein
MVKLLRIWKYALGSFSDHTTTEYDNAVCAVRSTIFITYLVTNCFITAGVIRHWNDVPTERLPLLNQSVQEEYIG